jgi:hypothetical protein
MEPVGRRAAREGTVTDSNSWQPPTGSTGAAQDSPFAPPTPPQSFGPPQPQVAPGWTPPPKPGLIPLRPLTLGTILGAAFQVLRRNPRPTFGFALLVTTVTTVVGIGVIGFVTFWSIARFSTATGTDAETLAAGSFAMIALSALVPIGLAVVGSAILQGIIALEVARGTLGEKLKLGGLWRAARGRIGALIGWSLLLTGALVVGVTLLATIVVVIAAVGGTAGIVAAVLLGIVLGLGAAVLYAWLATKLCLVPSVLLLERVTLRTAIARSWSLTNGYFWKTLGIQLLVAVIINVASNIVATPFTFLAGLGGSLIDPNGSFETGEGAITMLVVVYLITAVISIVFGALTAVVSGATPALIYIDIRMRKEGLDLELSRFVEARQAGDTSVPDPYLVKSGGVAQPATAAGAPWS